jgi:hypothetical protein
MICGSDQSAAETRAAMAGLADFLSGSGLAQCALTVLPEERVGDEVGIALKGSDVAVFWVRGRQLTEQGKAAVRDFLGAGRGIVVLGAAGGAWSDWPDFEYEVLGARMGGEFAGRSPMRIINLFPHPIFARVDHFETTQAMRRCELAPGAEVIMEGTVGEDTVPMGWVRRHGGGRVVVLEPAGRALFGDPDYRRIVSNSLCWAAARKVAQARTLVQRTYMADAYPGALAITFPEGPSLCYDTVRGGINYIWDGDFADLHPWWTGRHGEPLRMFAARFSGDVLYRDRTLSPAMHVGTMGDQSAYHFRGYRLRGDGFPELLYTVGGREVTEDLFAVGDGVGVVRAFHVASGPAPLWLKLDGGPGADIAVSGAVREGSYVHFDATTAGDFSVTIRRSAAGAP